MNLIEECKKVKGGRGVEFHKGGNENYPWLCVDYCGGDGSRDWDLIIGNDLLVDCSNIPINKLNYISKIAKIYKRYLEERKGDNNSNH